MTTTYAKIDLIDHEKIRKIVVEYINHALDNIDVDEICCQIECNEKLNKFIQTREKGDIDNNPKIAKFDRQLLRLIKLTFRNLKRHTKQMVPLYLVNKK
jgi:hypothetical protein